MARNPTSQDVADRAGVSRSAVSFVMNGRADGNIAKDKQLRILHAAKELNYTPNAVARSLQSQRTHTIGVVTDSIAGGPFAGKLLQGANNTSFNAGYLLLVIDTQSEDIREDNAFNTLLNRQVDALVFATMSLRAHQPHAAMRGVPSVLANSFDPAGTLRSVIPDEIAGGRAAAQVLLDAGHTCIAYLSGTGELVATERRTQGFDAALSAAGLPAVTAVEAGWEINDGFAAAMLLLANNHGHSPKRERPTGVVCANDRVALGVMLACGQLGLRVPEDLSIVGYDDDEPLARTTVPGLTTVALPHREMGERAVELLLADLNGDTREASGETILVPCPVVMRGSVASPTTAAAFGKT